MEPYLNLGGFVAVILFLWRLHFDLKHEIGDLRERIARLEGLFEGFTQRKEVKS